MAIALVFGAGGQLGRELLRHAPDGVRCIGFSHREFDICDRAAVREAMRRYRPRWVFNAAAFTAVDRAEEEVARAFAVNADGARIVAEEASAIGALLLHYSTDYVFDGRKGAPYSEEDRPNPLNVYGASKLAGEAAVAQAHAKAWIVRTSWVFAAHGHNFVRSILGHMRKRRVLRVVDDQIGKPTPAPALAKASWQLAQRPEGGLLHYACSPAVSWYRFACAILAEARAAGARLATERIEPIASKDWPAAARRPQNSVLATDKAKALGLLLPSWQEALPAIVRALLAEEA